MDWRYKAVLQSLFSITPRGAELNYAFQRYITRSLPTTRNKTASKVALAKRHLDLVGPLLTTSFQQAAFYEFGAGAELSIPLALYVLGVQHQIIVDIRRLARPLLVNATIAHLQALFDRPLRVLPSSKEAFTDALLTVYGIDYRAPCDARRTQLQAASIDCITSTDTLEHIPGQDIKPILAECRRILCDGGVMSFQIDYQDHYSSFDPHISAYNFLRYSDRHWALFSQSLHFQNRLRHSDYRRIVVEAGFEIIRELRVEGSQSDLETIRELPLEPRFRTYDPVDLATRGSNLLLRKSVARASFCP